MSAVRDPILKKQLAYERDHYTKGHHNDKVFRKTWPKIKRRMVRAGRHISAEIVRRAVVEGDAVLPVRPKKKHKLYKPESAALSKVVAAKAGRRLRTVGAKKRRRERWNAQVSAAKVELAERDIKNVAKLAAKKRSKKRPNQSPEPMVMSVTPRACARVAPATTMAHL